MEIQRSRRRLMPGQTLLIGFASLILTGALLLNLPMASRSGESVGFLNALFTSTSCVCVTGLTTVAPGNTYTLFGQIVMLVLIQFGGLGFMAVATMLFMLIGKRITLRERLVMQEALNEDTLQGLVRAMRRVIVMTLAVEMTGAALLSVRFIPVFGWAKGLYYGVWHAISAFCNAGFDVFGGMDSLLAYRDDWLVNLVIMSLIVVGGIGFTVILDVWHSIKNKSHVHLHTKLVLITTAILLGGGAIFFLAVEWNNPATLGAPGIPLLSKPLAAMFQSVTARTAGFATISQGSMTDASKLVTIILMFIGASPASTGGGVKTSTTAVIFLLIWSITHGRTEVTAFGRRINRQVVLRAIAIVVICMVLVLASTLAISLLERGDSGRDNGMVLHSALFETTSAFATVGLSLGVTPTLHPASKVFLILLMYAGRVGPLTLAMGLTRRQQNKAEGAIHLPEDRVMVG